MIDPESVPVPEGEEKPDIQANPQQAVKILQDGLNRRGLNGYEVAQIWNTRWRLRTTLEDIPGTKRALRESKAQGESTASTGIVGNSSAIPALLRRRKLR